MKPFSYLFLSVVLFTACKNEDVVKPIRKDLTHAVYASGKLYPKNHYTVLSKFPGYVERIHVRVGDSVAAGDVLITIKNETGEINVSSAENLFKLATDNAADNGALLRSLNQEVISVKAKYELDSVNYYRQRELIKNNATSLVNADQAKTLFESSRANYLRSVETLNNRREQLRIEKQNAYNQLLAAKSNRNDFVILSAVSGKVYDIIPATGDLIGSQSVLMEIGDFNEFEVELAIDETDISFIRLNQEVAYVIDAYRDSIFYGRITEIFPKVNSVSKTSRVKSSFTTSSDIRLFSTMSVEANIRINEKKNVLVIPRDYVKDGNKVLVKDEKELRTIVKGVEDLEFVEVISGIDENASLVRP